mgnify:FL=1
MKGIMNGWLMGCICLLMAMFLSCRNDMALEQVLDAAGEHRPEWEYVLEHYRNDRQKYAAVRFLLVNMPGAFSRSRADIPDGRLLDLTSLPASRLITEIDQAFNAWRENVYTRDCSFDDFCEYILPYRQANGILIDSARQVFYARHHGKFFTQPGKDMTEEVDSLLYLYRHLIHVPFGQKERQLLSVSEFERYGQGLCEHRCWYNTLLLTSLGMATATDFVPAWGNRNKAHSWNVLLKDGRSYAFEPFWDEDRWKYKRIYNNLTFDEIWGCFRLPKVYRNTYRYYLDGPAADKDMRPEDVPTLFRIFRKKDVSHEYFDTVNVRVELPDVPEGMKYAYLCVMNDEQWQPVQWGKIEGGQAVFKGMGRGVIYLPMYFRKGYLHAAGMPFLLQDDGKSRVLVPSRETHDVVSNQFLGANFYPKSRVHHPDIAGTVLVGALQEGKWKDTLCVFPDRMEMHSISMEIGQTDSIRYVRMHLPHGCLSLGDLRFFQRMSDGGQRRLSARFLNELPVSPLGETADNIWDEWPSTGYNREISAHYVDIDLGETSRLSRIGFCPYMDNDCWDAIQYELFYWVDGGWKSLGCQYGGKPVRYSGVPKNALLIIKPVNCDWAGAPRPFLFEEDNEVYWY